MAIIELRRLSKPYNVYQKSEGLLASLRGLMRREYREVQAVRAIDFFIFTARRTFRWGVKRYSGFGG